MEKVFEIRPMIKAQIIIMSVLLLLSTLGGIHIGLGHKTVFLVVFLILLCILHLINVLNVIEFYHDRVRIQNSITKKSKTFKYESISKIKFDSSKSDNLIKIKFKNGKTKERLCNCTNRKMQDAEEKFRSIFPHMS